MNTILVLSVLGLVTLFTGVYNLRRLILPLAITGIAVAFVVNFLTWDMVGHVPEAELPYARYLKGMLQFDNFAVAFSAVLIAVSFIIFFLSDYHYAREGSHIADIYALMLFTLAGGLMMVSYNNLTMLFIGIETLSIPLYILAGSRKFNLASNEAALKYFLMGAFSTGFLLFGIALMFGVTGSFALPDISDYVTEHAGRLPLIFKAGMFMMMIGLLFKVSAVPFHFWAPDVYEGSPTLITTFMATVVKTAAFAALFRLFHTCFGGIIHEWFHTIWVVTALTITIGNLSALYQKSVKRMLAYSSLSNAGYLLIAVLALNDNAASALLYYTAAYSLATVCAFAVLMLVAEARGGDTFEDFHGLARSNPLLAGIMTLALLSLAGIPPLAGFFGKYYLFANAMENGHTWIVVIAILNSLVGVYYYFRVIVAMLASEPVLEKLYVKSTYLIVLLLSAAGIAALGIFPNLITDLLR